MWTYTRQHSLHKRPQTIHFDKFSIEVDADGLVTSPVTPEMEELFKKHRAFKFEESSPTPNLSAYFAVIDAAMAAPLDSPDVEDPVSLIQDELDVFSQLTAPAATSDEEGEETVDPAASAEEEAAEEESAGEPTVRRRGRRKQGQ